MERLDNTIQPYAWGSRAAIAALQGRSISATPEAELWMGAHPSAPSRVNGASLLSRIAEDPESWLGTRTLTSLPFLFKVLAADEPLSLQAHPSREQAREGFEREDRAGIARDAPHRNYRDQNHKPELLCALGPFVALCGFREIAETSALFTELGIDLDVADLRRAFHTIMTTDVSPSVAAIAAARPAGRFAREIEWGARLAAKYPGDRGVLGAMLLNLVFLAEGEAIYLPAGNLHAYLHGVGVEIMANSDNVLRGGMTPKHVDVDELMRVLDFRTGPVPIVRPTARGPLQVWETEAPDFELARATVSAPIDLAIRGPTIVLCTRGEVRADDRASRETLRSGESAFVRGSADTLTLDGQGTVFLAYANTKGS